MPTPVRNVRIADDVWLPAVAKAKAENTTVTAVISAALADYAVVSAVAAASSLAPKPRPAGRCDHRLPAGAFCKQCGAVR